MQDIGTGSNDVGAPAGGASHGGAGQHGGEGHEKEQREGERGREPAEGREPRPDRAAGTEGSRQRELERWGDQEPEPMSERGLGPGTGAG
jgi:hypothetical protein